jgi:hypothetical protein
MHGRNMDVKKKKKKKKKWFKIINIYFNFNAQKLYFWNMKIKIVNLNLEFFFKKFKIYSLLFFIFKIVLFMEQILQLISWSWNLW